MSALYALDARLVLCSTLYMHLVQGFYASMHVIQDGCFPALYVLNKELIQYMKYFMHLTI